MATITKEAGHYVFQRARAFLAAVNASPYSFDALLALKKQLAAVKPVTLGYADFNNLTAAVNLHDAASTLHAIFVRKRNTATDAFVKFNDSATATAGGANGANMQICIPLLVGKDEVLYLAGTPGQVLANGFATRSETTGAGGTNSASGDGPDGFIIIS